MDSSADKAASIIPSPAPVEIATLADDSSSHGTIHEDSASHLPEPLLAKGLNDTSLTLQLGESAAPHDRDIEKHTSSIDAEDQFRSNIVETGFAALPGGVLDGAGTGLGEKGTLDAVVPGVGLDDYPDGGLRAWLVVLGAWCVSFTTWGVVNGFGVYQDYYSLHQLSGNEGGPMYTASDISWIGSLQLCLVLACSIFVGTLFDRGHVKWLLLSGTVIYTASLFGLSASTTYLQIFFSQGVGCGLAAGFLFLPAVSSISHYFRKRRATALGILATGSSLGGVVYPILLNKLFAEPSVGFAGGVRASAYLTLGLLVIANLTIRTRLPPRKTGRLVDFAVFKELPYSLFVSGQFCVLLGIYTPQFFLQIYAVQNGVPTDLAFYSLSILNGASLFGRLIPNYLADIYGPLTVLFPSTFITGILTFVWIVAGTTSSGLIAFSVVYGFFSGAFVSMLPACVASLTGEARMQEIGLRLAMSFLVVSLAALAGTPIAGAIVSSQNGSFTGAAIASGVFVLVGSLFIFAARLVVVQRTGNRWV